MNGARRTELIAVLLLGLCVGRAAGHEEVEKHGPATVTLHLDRTTVALSDDHLTLTLSVEGPTPLEVDAPTPLAEPRDVWMQRPEKPTLENLPNQRQRWQLICKLEPRVDQHVPLQIGTLRFRAGDADRRSEQTWKPITIQVTHRRLSTNPDEASLKNLHDISPIETVPPPPDYRVYFVTAGVVLVAVILMSVLVWMRRRAVEPVREPTPAETALAALDGIDALDLPGEREVERFHVLVSDVLRRYLEKCFGLPATEQTTPEFLDGLRRSSLLTADQQEALRAFLGQCDLAKFARADFSAGECKALGRLARELIRQTTTPAGGTKVAVNGQVPAR